MLNNKCFLEKKKNVDLIHICIDGKKLYNLIIINIIS